MRTLLPVLSLTLFFSCATKPRGSAETAAPPARIRDSAPEKRAALRAADPKLGTEGDEQRWGIEAAREHKARTDAQKRATSTSISPTQSPAPPTGPFDIRAKDTRTTTAPP